MRTSKCEVCHTAGTSLVNYLLTCHECFRSWHNTCCVPPIHDEVMADLRQKMNGLGVTNWQCKECGDAQLRHFRCGGPDITYVYWNRGRKDGTDNTAGGNALNRNLKRLVKSEPPDDCTPRAADVMKSDDSCNSAISPSRKGGHEIGLPKGKLRAFMMEHLMNEDQDSHIRVTTQEMKFWNSKTREVTGGAEVGEKPISLRNLCGRYHWVYGEHEIPEVEADSNSESEECNRHIIRNYLEFWLPEGGQERDARGRFRFENTAFRFEGVTPKEDTMNVWEVNELDVAASWLAKDGAIIALKVADDSGNPFLQFEWGPRCCGRLTNGMRFSLVGKKESISGKWKPLSERERGDLGIDVDERVTRAIGMLLDDPVTRYCLESTKDSEYHEPSNQEVGGHRDCILR